MSTSQQMSLLELKAIIMEMAQDQWRSRDSMDAEEVHNKQQKYWAKVEADKKLKKDKKPEGFFSSLFKGKSLKENALGDWPEDIELKNLLDNLEEKKRIVLAINGIPREPELFKIYMDKLIDDGLHDKVIKISNFVGLGWL